jgi:phage terminase small subunit|tara:strand:- start:576 stop:1136 length:561 start_codon:yes stop_codon:yes gene_type:complete
VKKQKKLLTDKQKQFAVEYLIDRNGGAAAIRAGFSEKGSRVTASRLLTNPNIRAIIDKKTAKLIEKTEMTAERAMLEVKAIATSNIMDGMEYDPNTREFSFKAPDEVPAEFWKAAQEVTVYSLPNGGGMATKVKMHPKIAALKMEYERHKLTSPETTTNNIANMHVNILEVNAARRRAGRKEIEGD